jgi:hypothetical protein
MKTMLALMLFATAAFAGEKKEDISVSFSSDDSRVRLASRHVAGDARLAVPTRSGSAVLLLTRDVVAVQLSDATVAKMETKKDAGFFEELVVAGVRMAVSKAVEYPVAHIRSAEIRDGALVLTSDQGKPVFEEIRVNGEIVTRNIAIGDAAKFVKAFRAVKTRR